MLTFFKKVFYRAIPTAHISAYIRFLYLQKALKKVKFRNILDAGCGPGLFSFYIAKKYPEARVTGYDISPLDIETCNKKKNSDYINNVSFYCVDIRTPFHDKNFDFIFSIEILRFWKMFGLLLNMEDNSILQCHKSPDIGSFSLKDISITIFPGQRKSTLVSNTIWPPCQQFFAR